MNEGVWILCLDTLFCLLQSTIFHRKCSDSPTMIFRKFRGKLSYLILWKKVSILKLLNIPVTMFYNLLEKTL
jgi:hypothetical protein